MHSWQKSSSAYRAYLTGSWIKKQTSIIATRNKVGLNTEHFGTQFSIECMSKNWFHLQLP